MFWRIHTILVIALVQVFVAAALTDTNDRVGLLALKDIWTDFPPNWSGDDPCGTGWDGISCVKDRVVSITLANTNLGGKLSSDITKLSELQTLDLSYNKGMTGSLPSSIGDMKKLTSLILVGCGFSGQIPSSIGSLQQLRYLSLNLNGFIGEVPPSIGKLSNLYWLDLAENKLTGSIPVSDGDTPGLDMLVRCGHFHFGKNQLSGEIPAKLFHSNMSLIHVLFEDNRLTGGIPSTLGLVQTLEVVRLDRNSLSGPVPRNLNNLTKLQELFLANNKLDGPLPNLTGMVVSYVEMSNNSFDATDVPGWFSSLQSLTSLFMENTRLQGPVPASLFSLPQLQTVALKGNRINGSLNIGSNSERSGQLQLIDLQNNLVDGFTQRAGGYGGVKINLVGNPICNEGETADYCTIPKQVNSSYSTPADNCTPDPCTSGRISSPSCKCAFPFIGTLYFRSPSFSNYGNSTLFTMLHTSLIGSFKSHSLPVDSVSVSNPFKNIDAYLLMTVYIFPSGQDYFNHTGVSSIGFMLSNQTFKPPKEFGPFYFIGDRYQYFSGEFTAKSHKSANTNVIIGAAVGGVVLVLLLVLAGVYAFRQKRIAETAAKQSDPFASWDQNANSGGVPQLKGVKNFTYEELKRSTNNFSESNDLGKGGYGRVYRGILPGGQLVAIKRAQQGSMQGGLEFKTEIELLSRVHHKNVVGLVGFCFDQGEQMLVYEYIANGTLMDSLSGKMGLRLDWIRRLRIALGAARGIQYLHDLANPPIIHRDIKSTNILLDDRLSAKVADFGLSKPMGESDRGHVTTQVKGTMGYLDPEYYMTQQLTEKSDVYSFGVLLLELLTARLPIEKGKYIVREVKQAMDRTRPMYNLHNLLDPIVANSTSPRSVEMVVDLALRCVQESGIDRPAMSEVAKEIENILEVAGVNPNSESASTSASHDVDSKGFNHPYSNESLFAYSGAFPPSRSEPL